MEKISLNEQIDLLQIYATNLVMKYKDSMLELCDKVKEDERLGAGDLMTILSSSTGMILAKMLCVTFEFVSTSDKITNDKLDPYQRTSEALAMLCNQALSVFCSSDDVKESFKDMKKRLIPALLLKNLED